MVDGNLHMMDKCEDPHGVGALLYEIKQLKSIVLDMLQKGFLPCPGEYGLKDYSNEHGLCEKILVISDENICEVCWNKALRGV